MLRKRGTATTQMPSVKGWGARVALCCVLVFCWAVDLQGRALGGGEYVRLRGEAGLVQSYPGTPLFNKPYRQSVLNKALLKISDPKKRATLRVACVGLVQQFILFSDIPVKDIENLILPVMRKVGGNSGQGAEKDYWMKALRENSRKCSWNAMYAIARAKGNKEEVARLEKEALSCLKTTRADYAGDLMAWYLKGKPEEAIAKLTKLKEVHGRDQRLDWSLEKARAQLELNKLKTEAEKRSRLIAIARDQAKSLALRGWAIRKLSDYPGKETTEFLKGVFESPHDAREVYLGFEAQEALKKLKVFPEGVHRYTPV